MKKLWRLSLRLSFPPEEMDLALLWGISSYFPPTYYLSVWKNGAGSQLQAVLLMVSHGTKLFLL